MSESLYKFDFLYVFDSFPLVILISESLTSLCAHLKSNLSDSLPLLFTEEWQERFALFHNQIAISLTKNEQIVRKTDEQIPNPAEVWQFNYSLIGPPFSTEE